MTHTTHRAAGALYHAAYALAAALLLTATARPSHSQPPAIPHDRDRVTYTMTPHVDNPGHELLGVTMTFKVPADAHSASVQIPVWSPGDYHVQNFAQYVKSVRAYDAHADARALTVSHPAANTWTVDPAGSAYVEIAYSVSAAPPGYFSQNVQLLSSQVFVNGPSAFMYLVGAKEMPVTLDVSRPRGWVVETPLAPGNTQSQSAGSSEFAAPDYDTLADSPIVMAPAALLKRRSFTYHDAVHTAVYFGHAERLVDVDAYTPVLKKIVETETRIMGVTPYRRYDFMFDVDGQGGGLEHLNACRIAIPAGAPPRLIAAFVAHEFFHLWNVKRIRPLVLGPFDYIHPPHTRGLWFAEGVTEYYAQLSTLRAGLTTSPAFLRHYRRQIDRLEANPARLHVTADEASERVWDSGNSEGFQGLSYYDKGELIGLCLDLKIRHESGGKRSLDDVMRVLYARHAPPRPGYGEDELRSVVSEVAGPDLSAFYDLLARSTEEMPFASCLAYAGLEAEMQPVPHPTAFQTAVHDGWLGSQP